MCRSALIAHLHDAIVLARRLDHQPTLAQIVRGRLLDVDVLAGATGPDGRRGVPVVRSGNRQGRHRLVIESAAEVLFDLRLFRLTLLQLVERLGDDVAVGIADVGDFHVLKSRKAGKMPEAAAVNTHDGQDDLFIGTIGGAGVGGGRESNGGSGEEIAAVRRGHGGTSWDGGAYEVRV